MIKKNGFTLIELLAVMVILAILAVITTPLVLGYIEDTKKETAMVSAKEYLKAIEQNNMTAKIDKNYSIIGSSDVEDINEIIKIKGDKPTDGSVIIADNNTVEMAALCINGYLIDYDNGEITGIGNCNIENQNCKIGMLCSKVSVGDYVKMTPTLTSFTTDTSYTGYTSVQTINPGELNLWRIIRINDDGTIDMVSEYVSSEAVYFQGQTGYKNLVGYLNVLASKYENSNYTIGSRYIGYNGQTEYLTNTANTVDSTSTTAPWSSSTKDLTVESQGGGDTLYTTDTNLVKNAIGTLVVYPVGETTASAYWLASRWYIYDIPTNWTYNGRYVHVSGSDSGHYDLYGYYSNFYHASGRFRLRPIITLKSDVYVGGKHGTSSDPWVLE